MKCLLGILVTVALFLGANFASAQSPNALCYTTNGSNCAQAVAASNSLPIAISSATTTQIVAAVTGQTIYVTSWDLVSSAGGTFKWVYGTGTNCGTGQHDLTGTYTFGTSTVFTKGNGLGTVLYIPIGNALCAISSGSIIAQGSISYVQF